MADPTCRYEHAERTGIDIVAMDDPSTERFARMVASDAGMDLSEFGPEPWINSPAPWSLVRSFRAEKLAAARAQFQRITPEWPTCPAGGVVKAIPIYNTERRVVELWLNCGRCGQQFEGPWGRS